MITEGAIWVVQKAAEYSLASFSSWENLTASIGRVARIFTDLESGLAWPYLLASLMIAGGVYVFRGKSGAIPARSFKAFLFPRRVYRHPSAILDYKFYAINIFLKFLLFVPIMVGMGMVGYKVMTIVLIGYLSWEPPRSLSAASAFGTAFGFYILYDFINYWAHVLFHKVPALWAFHRVHHSAQVLTPITAFRAHPMELLFPAVLHAPVIGLAGVFYQNLSTQDMQITTIFGIGIFAFVFGLLGHHLQHSHVWLSFGPVLSRVYISPAQHQIHHSSDPRHRDKNFGVKFAVWDALFCTLYVPKAPETIQVGLPDADPQEFSTVCKLYFLPFKKSVKECIGLARKLLPAGLSQERCR
jgi:sterol desaturase/sphingolipid hydroxylase (fatty acid hydroxylase superfamily)